MSRSEKLDAARTRWYSGEAMPGISFRLEDVVTVIGGDHAGATGSIVSLEALEPEPAYLVELTSGDALIEPQSNLRPLADRPGA